MTGMESAFFGRVSLLFHFFSTCFPWLFSMFACSQELKNLARSVSALQASVGEVQELKARRVSERFRGLQRYLNNVLGMFGMRRC